MNLFNFRDYELDKLSNYYFDWEVMDGVLGTITFFSGLIWFAMGAELFF